MLRLHCSDERERCVRKKELVAERVEKGQVKKKQNGRDPQGRKERKGRKGKRAGPCERKKEKKETKGNKRN